MKNDKFIFSCVIISAANVNDLNESINIKNPFGVETFELVFNLIYSSLIPCSITPIFAVILEIKTEDEEYFTKIVLDRTQLEKMTIEEIKVYLKDKCHIFFFKKNKINKNFWYNYYGLFTIQFTLSENNSFKLNIVAFMVVYDLCCSSEQVIFIISHAYI